MEAPIIKGWEEIIKNTYIRKISETITIGTILKVKIKNFLSLKFKFRIFFFLKFAILYFL